MINYNQKIFRSASNTDNGEVGSDTVFYYRQEGNIVAATYHGGSIVQGHLIAKVDEHGNLDMRYHHINQQGELMTGVCQSTPKLLPNGKVRLYERWKWTCGDYSSGESIIEEI